MFCPEVRRFAENASRCRRVNQLLPAKLGSRLFHLAIRGSGRQNQSIKSPRRRGASDPENALKIQGLTGVD
jgi:hypothetical protein